MTGITTTPPAPATAGSARPQSPTSLPSPSPSARLLVDEMGNRSATTTPPPASSPRGDGSVFSAPTATTTARQAGDLQHSPLSVVDDRDNDLTTYPLTADVTDMIAAEDVPASRPPAPRVAPATTTTAATAAPDENAPEPATKSGAPAAGGRTPMPWRSVLTLSLCMWTNAFLMLESFHVTDDPNQLGTYSGWLTASMMIGGTISSYPWGLISDKYGRKPVLILGLLSTSVFVVLFGFSTSFPLAILWRTVSGLCNGVVGTAKAMMAEVCDRTNLAGAFSVMSVFWGLGVILGPLVGGLLARPAALYPNVFPKGSFFDTWPWALPCIFGAVVGVIASFAAYWTLPETRTNVAKLPLFSFLQDKSSRRMSLATDGKTDAEAASAAKPEEAKSLTFWQLCRDGPIFLTAFLYGCTAAVEITYMEATVLWAKMPLDQGGVAFDSADIGFITSLNGVVTLVFQLLLFPMIERKLGPLTLFRVGTLLPIASHQLTPRVPQLWPGASHGTYRAIAAVLQSLAGIGSTCAFTTVFVMVSNSALDKDKGSANGLGQTFASTARIIFPILSGSVFSASLYNSSEPFDYHFVFFLVNIFSLITFASTFWLDPAINGPREAADEERSKRAAAAASSSSSSSDDDDATVCAGTKAAVAEAKSTEA
ncbi:hypothetical protein GGF31_006135 [Allomyces arbusculus]|nr:hypothetical protein GGF31_006135 [Allomyces arbusculus]